MFDKLLKNAPGTKDLRKGFSQVSKLTGKGWNDKELADFIYKSSKKGLTDEEISDLLYHNSKTFGGIKNLTRLTKLKKK